MASYSKGALTVTIEPIKSCNIDCAYCYCYNDKGVKMDFVELDFTLQRFKDYVEEHGFSEIHFIWHGGEPLLAGFNFFQYAFKQIARVFSQLNVCHFMQTNGLLIDDGLLALFEDYQVDVGISLDGPEDIHDATRVDAGGKGTHKDVMQVVESLGSRNIALGFNAVLNKVCIDQAERIYQFFQNLGYGFRVNPILVSPSREQTQNFRLPPLAYGEILCDLFDAWTNSTDKRVPVSPISAYMKAIISGSTTECQHSANCVGENLGVKPGGEVFLCTRFEEYTLGNLNQQSIAEINRSWRAQQVAQRRVSLDVCQTCKYQTICNGGCPHNAHTAFNTVEVRDPYCHDYQMIFSHIKKSLRPFDEEQQALNGNTLIAVGR